MPLMFVENVCVVGFSPTQAVRSDTITLYNSAEISVDYSKMDIVLMIRVPVEDSIFTSSPVALQQYSTIPPVFKAKHYQVFDV